MVVSQFNVKGVLSLKSEDDAPIGPHGHRPESLQVALQRVRAIARQIESLWRCRRIENRKDSFHRVQQVGPDPASVAALIEAPETPMLEAPDHENVV
jgi:hypothetical protein